jgi:hypothetical protein
MKLVLCYCCFLYRYWYKFLCMYVCKDHLRNIWRSVLIRRDSITAICNSFSITIRTCRVLTYKIIPLWHLSEIILLKKAGSEKIKHLWLLLRVQLAFIAIILPLNLDSTHFSCIFQDKFCHLFLFYRLIFWQTWGPSQICCNTFNNPT